MPEITARVARQVASFEDRYRKLLLNAPYLILLGLCAISLLGSAAYVASSLYALARGVWALPTTALIRWSPITEWAANNEPYFGYLLLMLAGVGAVMTWFEPVTESTEWPRLLWWCGLPITACAFILGMSATWAGMFVHGKADIGTVGGLNPFLDAGAYLAAIHDQAKDGYWNEIALYRPLASAFRSALALFTGFSLPTMLILQACLVAAATCFAASAVAAWRGIWAGLAFFALTYIYARYFVPTTLTEALGLFWALLSVPFFIESFRSRSAKPALVAFAMTAVALMTRMGSMFTLPALLVWLIWQFGQGVAAKLRIGAAALCILITVIGFGSLLKHAYGTATQPSSGNFAYVICGLTAGTAWDGCVTKAILDGKPLSGDAGIRISQLYSMAWGNFRAKPSVLFNRIADVGETFFAEFPEAIWQGYGRTIPQPRWLWRDGLTIICLMRLLYAIAWNMKSIERRFWALVLVSIAGSASIIYQDDGARTLAASHPLIALLLATGMSNPTASAQPQSLSRPQLSRYGTLGLVMSAILFFCVPWVSHHLFSDPVAWKDDEAFVSGGRRMSGFLVLADDQPLRNDIASVHLSTFDAMVTRSRIEIYQELIHPTVPPLPFGFVFAPRLEPGIQSFRNYIVPAEVLEHPEVSRWHFHLLRWGYKPYANYGELWLYVTKAEPWL